MNAIDSLYAPRSRKPCPECDYEGCDVCDGTGFAPEPEPFMEPATHDDLARLPYADILDELEP